MERLGLLEDLVARGDDDSEAAEMLRSEMDALWLKLSDTERSELSKTIKLVRRPSNSLLFYLLPPAGLTVLAFLFSFAWTRHIENIFRCQAPRRRRAGAR
jgi:hypothetical protein